MDTSCSKCGGTGEKFDDTEDWASPIEDCPACKGTGVLIEKCEQFEHVPNRTGHCVICGYEVVTEVDDDGTPKLD